MSAAAMDAVTLMPESREDFSARVRWGAPATKYRVHVTEPPKLTSTDPEFYVGLVDEDGNGLLLAPRFERARRKPREYDSLPEANRAFNRLRVKHPTGRVWMVPVLAGDVP